MKRSKLNKQKADVRNWPHLIGDIRNPLPCVQLAAVKTNSHAITYIKKPCRAVQLYCVKKYPALYECIANPHPLVKEYMLLMQL